MIHFYFKDRDTDIDLDARSHIKCEKPDEFYMDMDANMQARSLDFIIAISKDA